MITAYVYEPSLREKANANCQNYWYEYIKEISDQMGLCAVGVPISSLSDLKFLENITTLLVGDLTKSEITQEARENLKAWVSRGGILIGFATEGLDDLFGNNYRATTYQSDCYSISGYFSLNPDPLTQGIHSSLVPDQKLIILSDIRNIIPDTASALANLYDLEGSETKFAAITKREYHSGNAYYFAFNVPQTIWMIHQGKPVIEDLDDDNRLRTLELCVLGENSARVPYADEILLILQNMVGKGHQPFIHQIPPKGDEIPDALFFWGGDEEGIADSPLAASNWMKEKGLPYHANILYVDGEFRLSVEDGNAIEENGHEYSLHYNHVSGHEHPYHFTQEEVQRQSDAFYNKYGRRPICTVNHCLIWTGGTEPAEWMLEAGGQADNSFLCRFKTDERPDDYSGVPGHVERKEYYYPRPSFGFGTSYPFHFYLDYQHGNAKLDFLEEPITAYEIGYGLDKDDPTVKHNEIRDVVDTAAKYHCFINMFFHTYRIRDWLGCRNAIEAILDYVDQKGIKVIHLAPDSLCDWWNKRSAASISRVSVTENAINFRSECDYESGMIVKVPLGNDEISIGSVACDGDEVIYQTKHEFGQNWIYLILPKGGHEIEISLTSRS